MSKVNSKLVQFRLPIIGMSCAGCVARIEKALNTVPGVSQVQVNLATHIAEVQAEPMISRSALRQAIETLGYHIPLIQQEIMITGMHCGGCSAKIQKQLLNLSGVLQADVNFASGRATIYSDLPVATLVAVIEKLGYRARPLRDPRHQATEDSARRQAEQNQLQRDLNWALILALPIIILEMTGHLLHAWEQALTNVLDENFSWLLQWFLTSLMLMIPGRRFFQFGIPALLRRAPEMNSLVALASLAAYSYSTIATFTPNWLPSGTVNVYFEAVATIILLILVGRYLESRAKNQTSQAITRLVQLQPATARRWQAGKVKEVSIEQLNIGDQVEVRPGEQIPLDGEIVEGESYIDESMLTGESQPIAKAVGDNISGGTLNQQGWLRLMVTATGSNTKLAQIIRLVEQAQGTKIPIQRLVDNVTLWFVPAVLLAAMLTFVLWFCLGPTPALSFALVNAVSVLIIACPCAMGLATPTSIMVASGRAADAGILFRESQALQRLQRTRVIALDKTGTLTLGQPMLVDIALATAKTEHQVIALAASLESRSQHPIASALLKAATSQAIDLSEPDNFENYNGLGISGTVLGYSLLLGNQRLMQKYEVDTALLTEKAQTWAQQGKTTLYLTINGQVAALFAIADKLKPTTPSALADLKQQGFYLVMLSGDSQQVAQQIAKELAFDEVIADMMPEEKVTEIQRLQRTYGSVAFVGDGINDAPALATADVGLAIGQGTDIAIESADIVLMSGKIDSVNQAINLSRQTLRNIKQNLFWAFAYNVALIPIAAGILYPAFGILLSPIFAAAAMALSSLFVLANALRLRSSKLSRIN